MKLRTRLLVGFGAVVAVLSLAMIFVVRSQRSYLLERIDQQLSEAARFGRGGLIDPRRMSPPALPPPGDADASDLPASSLFIGMVTTGGTLIPLVSDALFDDIPDVDPATLSRDPGQSPRTVGADGEADAFRLLTVPRPDGVWVVFAIPLEETDAAINRLLVTLGLASLLVVAALAATTWGTIRHGLRPIRKVTEAAAAVAAGSRGRRVEDSSDDARTEAGLLVRTFNQMLDERDAADGRLRQFVADASHELRTPLTSIRGYSDLILDNAFSATQQHDAIGRIQAESLRMGSLIEDLLTLARLDEGRPLAVEEVDLAAIVEETARDARAVQPTRSIVVDLDDGERSALVVTGDDARLRQVFGGLVHNAVVHTPLDSEIHLSVRLAGERVMVCVADTGPGFDAEFAEHAFDRFSRGDSSRSRNAGGAGLGLSIARSIVEAHGGTLVLETSPGHGATFRADLPRKPD